MSGGIRISARLLGAAVGSLLSLWVLGVATAAAAAESPAWSVGSVALPTNLPPGGKGQVIVTAVNLGDAVASATNAQPLRVSATLPAGVTATSIEPIEYLSSLTSAARHPSLTCELGSLSCEASSGSVLIDEPLEVVIGVSVAQNAQSGLVSMSVSGGGGAPVSASDSLTVSGSATKFGVERYEQVPLNADGSFDTQAGSHPFQLTTTLAFNQGYSEETGGPAPLALPKDLKFDLPPGLIGNPSAVPQCPLREFQSGAESSAFACPADTQVGVVTIFLALYRTHQSGIGHTVSETLPVYNLEPSVGEPARFAFLVVSLSGGYVPVYLDTSLRTGGDYGVVVTIHNISQEVYFVGSQVSIWGFPGDPRHDLARGSCVISGEYGVEGCAPPNQLSQSPFLTLPASCAGLSNPLAANMEMFSWAQPSVALPDSYALHGSRGEPVGLDGCDRLPFNPSISVSPDDENASTPTGLTVGIHVAQNAALNPTGLAEANVKDTTVTLPVGVRLNPAAASGLSSCSLEQVGLETAGASSCPESSKVGTVEINTPLLPEPVVGAAYLAAQNANPFGSLVALYMLAEDRKAGVRIKVPGEVRLDPVTGQVVSTFDNTPQLPFEDFKVHFFGGDRAPLATPAMCGSHTTTSSIAPWSGNAPVTPASTFDITAGPNGSACADPLPFSPSLTVGTTSIQAGGFSPFTMTVSREDGQQNIQQIVLHMPAGLSGLLSGVELCGEAQADAGTCGSNSLIGETTVSVGLGGDPYSVTGGKVYITGPYEGAPFGLSVVVPAKAGPYDLGTVVVRGRIEVSPLTAALTVTTNSEAQGHAIPHILDGIPLEIKHVNFVTTRPGFTFNPTDCDKLGVTGSIASAEGSSSPVAVPFQVTNCAALSFKPTLTVSTSAKTSRTEGASLHVGLTLPAQTGQGTEANVAKVKVSLPKQLPSPLKTLQKACLEKTFAENPASCPVASQVGHAKVVTPLLSGPLTGTAYFVSHGGAKYPELIIVLTGEDGVTVQVHGETFISKAGITSATFSTVPDVPFSNFELTLPQREFPALTADGNLCKGTLSMPTEMAGQNGAVIDQNTKIAVVGCPKAKKVAHKKKRGRHGHGRGEHANKKD